MVRKVTICTSTCPYCGNPVSRDINSPGVWGMKYGRCDHCKKIYRTGKRLYSDLSPEERLEDKKEMSQAMRIGVPGLLLSFAVACVTGWELVGLVAFLFFIFTTTSVIGYYGKTKETLMKYDYLKTKDPELYQLEYAESMRIIQKREIHTK